MYLIVEQIGVWILLALGLNVVVGFAGLLDLGFAAFYAIGAYTDRVVDGRAARSGASSTIRFLPSGSFPSASSRR